MTLYHFCADKHVKSILRQGLTIGAVAEPTHKGFVLRYGYIWLTLDGDPAHQSWATKHAISYSRTAWRLTIEMPEGEALKLFDRYSLPLRFPGTYRLFDGWPGSEDWRVYHGMIPKQWITKAERI